MSIGSSRTSSTRVARELTPDFQAKELSRVEGSLNTVVSDPNQIGRTTANMELLMSQPAFAERRAALEKIFDKRIQEIQQSRLQPGRAMITGRQ